MATIVGYQSSNSLVKTAITTRRHHGNSWPEETIAETGATALTK